MHAGLDWEKCIEKNGYPEELEKIHQHFKKTLRNHYSRIEEAHKVTLEFEYMLDDGRSIIVKLSLSPYWPHDKPEELFDVLETTDSHEKREL